MRKLTVCLLVLLCLFPHAAHAAVMNESGETVVFPQGVWVRAADGAWSYLLSESVYLPLVLCEELDIPELSMEDGLVRSGFSLTLEQLTVLFPEVGDLLVPPPLIPRLEHFELTGSWYYGDDGVLYYNHGDGFQLMTVDEVFGALRDPAISVPPETGAEEKIIYLTIDDAPSPLTMDVLAMLDQLDVKATFFVVGAYVRTMPTYLRAIYGQGHTIANHSYSHDAQILSSSFSACLNDFKRTERVVAEALGFDLPMPILRIPYGASTVPASYRTQLQQAGYAWIDWNALNGDTEAAIKTDQAALQRAISTASRTDGNVVLLVHDNKKRTIRTLPALVEHFRAQGYAFRALDFDTLEDMPNVRMGMPR